MNKMPTVGEATVRNGNLEKSPVYYCLIITQPHVIGGGSCIEVI